MHYVVHSDCCCVCLRTTLCARIALVFACVLCGALWMPWCCLVHWFMHCNCFGVCMCHTTNTLTAFVCLRDVLYNVSALVFACVMCHALRLLWCLPVHYLLHSHCYCDGLRNTSCTMIALAFPSCTLIALVLAWIITCALKFNWWRHVQYVFHALWLLWCWHVQYLMHCDCSCVCLCDISCAMLALVFANVLLDAL